MIDTYGRKKKRLAGKPRRDNSIYKNLGHPYDIRQKLVAFTGNEEKTYCLTKGKEYRILSTESGKFHYDTELLPNKKRVERKQSEDFLIVIINDKGHKRKYAHNMFTIVKEGN